MLSLIPRDYWQLDLGDTIRACAAACSSGGSEGLLALPGVGECVPVRSGRAALVVALQALGLPNGARVGIPLYCCPVLFRAIRQAGCVPCFLDVDPATGSLSPELVRRRRGDFDALVAVHMFGNACDIPELRSAAGPALVIEDCAQALGTRWGDRGVGTSGDASFFSFRAGKYLSVGEGGALYSPDPATRERMLRIVEALPRSSAAGELRHVATGCLKAALRRRPWYGAIGYRLWRRAGQERRGGEVSGVAVTRMHRADSVIARRRLAGLSRAIEDQRAHARHYSESLRLPREMLSVEPSGARFNRYLFPLVFETQGQRDWMAKYLLERGIDTMKYLDGVVETAIRDFAYAGGCPGAERLSRCVLTIPCYHGLGAGEVRGIAEAVNRGWERLVAGRT